MCKTSLKHCLHSTLVYNNKKNMKRYLTFLFSIITISIFSKKYPTNLSDVAEHKKTKGSSKLGGVAKQKKTKLNWNYLKILFKFVSK